jgi:hypothetical protein
MEQILEGVLVKIWKIWEEMKAGHEEMKAGQDDLMAILESWQEEM